MGISAMVPIATEIFGVLRERAGDRVGGGLLERGRIFERRGFELLKGGDPFRAANLFCAASVDFRREAVRESEDYDVGQELSQWYGSDDRAKASAGLALIEAGETATGLRLLRSIARWANEPTRENRIAEAAEAFLSQRGMVPPPVSAAPQEGRIRIGIGGGHASLVVRHDRLAERLEFPLFGLWLQGSTRAERVDLTSLVADLTRGESNRVAMLKAGPLLSSVDLEVAGIGSLSGLLGAFWSLPVESIDGAKLPDPTVVAPAAILNGLYRVSDEVTRDVSDQNWAKIKPTEEGQALINRIASDNRSSLAHGVHTFSFRASDSTDPLHVHDRAARVSFSGSGATGMVMAQLYGQLRVNFPIRT